MSTKDERVRDLIAEQAAAWFVANRGGLSAAERDAFAAWLVASPVHIEEYLTLSVIARDLREACADSVASIDAIVARAAVSDDSRVEHLWPWLLAAVRDVPARRWHAAAVAMAAVSAVCVGLLVMWNPKPSSQVSVSASAAALRFETRHGEQHTYRLADDSVLHLNTDTAVTVRYSKTERLVVLTSGEVDFEVAREPGRAFRVFAGPAEVVDLGTQFDVRTGTASTVVTVIKGRVAVRPAPLLEKDGTGSSPDRLPRLVQLGADQQVTVTRGAWPAAPVAVDAKRVSAWLHRQIVFDHEPLARVAAEFNRYAAKPIEITTPELQDLEISGVFTTDNSEEFIAFLRSLDGVRVDVTATRVTVSRK